MAKVICTELQKDGASGPNITLDTSKNVTCENNLQVDGNVTVTGTLPADKLTGALPAISGASLTGISSPGSFRNLIINGAMQVNQRGTVANAGNEYGGPDRMYFFKNDGAMTISQDTDVPTGQGFANSWKCDVTSVAGTSGNNYVGLQQKIEGQNLQHVKKGTSNAEQLTLQFWIKSTKTGTYIAELWDEDNSRTCSKSYTVSTTNTWEKKTITFPADTTGALGNDNGDSFRVYLWFFAGSGFSSGTLNTTWAANTNANRAVGQVNACDNTSNNIYITGLQLEIGATATSFEFRSYGDELQKSLRYFYKTSATGATWKRFMQGRAHDSDTARFMLDAPVPFRAIPTATYSGNFQTQGGTYTANPAVEAATSDNRQLCFSTGNSGSGWTANWALEYMANDDTSASISFSAEL